ncbi:E3 ubiquitin-protein ligase DCST1 isoform X2 [Monodelphis domestica]|uniref:E3 ubiquitin-protein ligase DCST1 isoform X2 n=1 Tax=Monodelphis domestica TaxID=13616 RepID=UPI0024E1B24E|nr:E3 ubiquitin-protein ligase DCST1 isoform X2 [Monodelphis domestica]
MTGGKLSQARETGLKEQKKPPNTTVNRFLRWVLPAPCARFLWRKPGEFPVTAFLLGAGIGGLLSVGLTHMLVTPLSLYEEQKMILMYTIVGLGALGWGTSPHIRCASLLLIPKLMGKEGRLLVLGYILTAMYDGPVTNLRHNMNEVVLSLGCTVEMQINHTRMAWRVSTSPLRSVFKELLSKKEDLKVDTRTISESFKELDAQVESNDGFESDASGASEDQGPTVRMGSEGMKPSTQKIYEFKTKLRCFYIVDRAVRSCHRWFDHKHALCMEKIKVPLLNHLLCLPMTFKFLCRIAWIMEPWCRNRIPVEGNFGQTYDSLNQSMQGLGGEFFAHINVKKENQTALVGINVTKAQLREEVKDYIDYQVVQLDRTLGLLRVLLSCTFLLVFQAAFSYTDNYSRDIRFDNIYISTYFRQIDERRKKLGRRSLLPLRKAEKSTVIFPYKLTIQAKEMKNAIRELVESLPVVMLLLILCVLDWAFYTIFDTIRRHSFLQYSFSSSHHLEVKVGGDSMLARLLRRTIGALNTSSEMLIESSNIGKDTNPVPRAVALEGLSERIILLDEFYILGSCPHSLSAQASRHELPRLLEGLFACWPPGAPLPDTGLHLPIPKGHCSLLLPQAPPSGRHVLPPLPLFSVLAAQALRGVLGLRDRGVLDLSDSRLWSGVLRLMLDRHEEEMSSVHSPRRTLLLCLQQQLGRRHLRGVRGSPSCPSVASPIAHVPCPAQPVLSSKPSSIKLSPRKAVQVKPRRTGWGEGSAGVSERRRLTSPVP